MKMGLTIIEVNELDQTFRAYHKDNHSSQDLDGTYSISVDEDGDEYIEISKLNVDVLDDSSEDSHFDVGFDEEFGVSISEAITEYLEGK